MKTVDEIMKIVGSLASAGYHKDYEDMRYLRAWIEAALKEQAAHVAELERQITRPAPCARHCEAKAFKIEIRALERQIADLQRDAARYRRIRRGQHWSLVNGIGDVLTGEDMDKAVDQKVRQASAFRPGSSQAAIKAKERT